MDFQQKLLRFLRKPPRAKWLAIRAKLREFVNPTHALILHRLDEIHNFVRHSSYLGMEQWRKQEFTRERYADGKRLEPHGFKVYSQNDEDGMIQEVSVELALKAGCLWNLVWRTV